MIKPTHEDLSKTVAELEAEAERAILINISRVLECNAHSALKGLADALTAVRAPRVSVSSRERPEDLAATVMRGAATWLDRPTRDGFWWFVRTRGPSPWNMPEPVEVTFTGDNPSHFRVKYLGSDEYDEDHEIVKRDQSVKWCAMPVAPRVTL